MRFGVLMAGACCAALGVLARCNGDDGPGPCDACDDLVPVPLAISVTPQEIWVHPSAAAPVSISLARGAGGDGDVSVTIESDAGMTSDPLTIANAATTGSLVIHSPSSFAQGTTTLVIDAQTPTVLAQTSLIVHVAGASGTLDTSFGSAGLADLTPSQGEDRASAMIVLQSGVLVGSSHVDTSDAGSVSSIKILRLTSGGAADGTFATTTAPTNVMSALNSLAMMSNGNIYAVGDVKGTKASFAAVRVLADGGLDPKYAVATDFTLGDDIANSGAVEPGGNLVAAGSVGDFTGIGVARYTQVPLPPVDAGTSDADVLDASAEADVIAITSHLDPTFGDGGAALIPLPDPKGGASTVLVAPDGSLYVLGVEQDVSASVTFLHLTSAGKPDEFAYFPLTTGLGGALSAIQQPDGAILMAGDDNGQALVMRAFPVATLDSAFGTAGRAPISLGTTSSARALALDPVTGNILVAGNTDNACLIARLTPTGALDKTFASSGTLTIAQGDVCNAIAIGVDDNGLIVVLENFSISGSNHVAVARYWP